MYFSAENGGVACFDGVRDKLFGDEQIHSMLKGTVFLAAESAKNLIERGFSKYLGVDITDIPQSDTSASIEIISSSNRSVTRQVNLHRIIPMSDDVIVSSTVVATPEGVNGNKIVLLFPGVTIFKNEIGGVAVVFSGTPQAPYHYSTAFSFLCEARKEQLIQILGEYDELPIYYPDDAEVYLKAAHTRDGKLFCAFFNLSLDILENIPLVCDREIKNVKILRHDGAWENTDFEVEGTNVVVNKTAATLDPIILMLE